MPTDVDTAEPDAVADTPPRRGRRLAVAVAALLVVCLVLGAAGAWGYASTDLPPLPRLASATRITYSDGTTFARPAAENRTPVPVADVPVHVRRALVAAQDRDFPTSGNALTATGRAARRLVTGGGDESLTEKYVRLAYDVPDTRRGRARAALLAAKLEKSMSARTTSSAAT